MSKKNTQRVAFGGIISALSLVLMFFTGIIPALDYTLPAISGILLIALVLEFNKKTAYISFASVAILSFLITPNKEAAVLFVCFFGYYPILKGSLEKTMSRVVEWILKLVVFNIAVGASFLIFTYLLGSSELLHELEDFSKYGAPIFLGMANIAFLLYDFALSRLIVIYCRDIVARLRLR